MTKWDKWAKCPCGEYMTAPMGSIWFTKNSFPVCPSCGGPGSSYRLVTARLLWNGKWWNPLTWFSTKMEEKC